MVIFTALPPGTNNDEGRILVDESDYRGVDDERLPFEIKDVVRIRADAKFSKYYDCIDELGEGKFGKVYRCREKATGLELAAKRIKIKRDVDRDKVEREVAIMTQLRHPRIAQIYDAFATPDNDVVLIMEIVNGGELFDRVVDENYILTELAVVMIICQICEAISYVHSKNIVHLDLKPENIMCVSQTGNRIKLIDFGLAQFYDGSSNLLFMAGTPEFVAPEVIKFEPIDFYTDMWSIGVITYILLSGISPFLGETLGDTYVAVEKGEWEFDDEAFESISDAAKDFISKLLIMDQKQRMLPEDCLNHPWVVDNRAKVANDLILNQPNSGTPLSKEGLKSYLRNKRFRKATWALLFLIRFKRQTLMNFGRRTVSPAAVAELYDNLPVSIGKIMESCSESEASVSVTEDRALDAEKTRKMLADISAAAREVFDTSKVESITAIKHQEVNLSFLHKNTFRNSSLANDQRKDYLQENKLSSEIPKKKPKQSVVDEGKKKLKPSGEERTKKGAKKHKERNNEKSDEISCKPEKLSKNLKIASDGLAGQMKKPVETVSECSEINSKEFVPVTCEVCISLETTKPAVSFTEFSKPVHAAENAHLRSLISESAQTSKNGAETEGRPKKCRISSSDSRTAQESANHSSSVSKRSEINKKGSSVAAILSMFTEKAEQERKRFERRPSRPVRTFRDVEKSSSKKSSLIPTNENDGNCVKLYRAPEEEKERVKNLIELHRRGSVDRKQVDAQDIVAARQEGSKDFLGQTASNAKQDKAGMKGKSFKERKMEMIPALNAKKESDIKIIDQEIEDRSTDTKTMAKINNVRNETKMLQKDVTEFTKNQKLVGGIEKPAKNIISVEALQIQPFLASQRETVTQNDSSIIKSRKTKSWVKLNESQNDLPLNSLSTRLKLPKFTESNQNKQIETVNEKRALSSEPRLSEERCTAKKEVLGNADNRKVPKRRKNKVESIDRNPEIEDAARKLVLPKNSEKLIERQDFSSKKKVKEDAEKLKKDTTSTELVATLGSSHFSHKSKQMKSIQENKSEIQKSISLLQPRSADLTTMSKHTGKDHTDEILKCITSKKSPKATGISGRKKGIGETKVKKLQNKHESEIENINFNLKNGETVTSMQNKLPNSVNGALHSIQNTVISVQDSIEVFPSSRIPTHNAVERKVSRKSSCSKNVLVRRRSEINLADSKEKMRSNPKLHRDRKAVDDQVLFNYQRDQSHRSISIASLKNQENFSFGWLKLQLETRVNKEKEDQVTWRYRRDLEISPIQSGNAKKALNIWKAMEQSCIAKI
uniref:Protein kinase domain-containing protein n=1 Tax=Onchocerca volvulus TaxID=6282 RepID=A0A8R1TUF5_ONCVO